MTSTVAPNFPPLPPTHTSLSMTSSAEPVAQPRREMAFMLPSSQEPQRNFRREKQEFLKWRDQLQREFEAHLSALDQAYKQFCMEEERTQIREEHRALEAEKAWRRSKEYLGDQ